MARIRTIKPDFWDSPSTARASLRARLFFIAMWNWADDWGVGDGHAKRLLSFAFPYDESPEVESRNFRHLAAEVADCFGVVWYEVAGREYYAIPTWEEHQRTEKRAQRKNPGPDQAFSILYAESAENPPPSSGNVGEGRGKGEVGTRKGEGGRSAPSPAVLASEFDRAWSSWPKKVEKQPAFEKFKTKCRARVPSELADDIVRFGEAYAATTDKQFVPGLAVWLNRERWTDELPQVRAFDRGLTRTEENMQAVLEMRAREQAQEQPMWGELE